MRTTCAGVHHPEPRVVQAHRPARHRRPARVAPGDQLREVVAFRRHHVRLQRHDLGTRPPRRVHRVVDRPVLREPHPAARIARLEEPPRMVGGGEAHRVHALRRERPRAPRRARGRGGPTDSSRPRPRASCGRHPLPADHHAFGDQPRIAMDDVALHILEFRGDLGKPDDGGVPRRTWREPPEVGAADRVRRGDGGPLDHLGQRHAEGEELRHRAEEVPGRPLDAERVDVRRDRVGPEPRRHHLARRVPGERPHPVAHVEQHASLPRRDHRLLDAAISMHRRVREGAEAMGQHVARPQPLHHRLVGRRRLVDMAHHVEPHAVGHVERHVERRDPRRSARVPPDPHLDPDDDVAVRLGHRRRLPRRHEPHVVAFADHDRLREAEDAREGDVEVDEHPRLRPVDHMRAEAREVPRPRAARVDGRRDRALPRIGVGLDAQRRAAPVDMGMQVDEPRRHDRALDVPHLAPREPLPNGRDLAARESHVEHRVGA